MTIKTAEFKISSSKVEQCPADNKPEYAFIGRSNVGKSSLINTLARRNGLAKTSGTPGKTTLINHFIVNNEWYLVDLPGYGFAKRSKSLHQQFEALIRGYILKRTQMSCLFLLIDIRHEPQPIDLEFIEWLGLSQVPFAIIFTKADKLSNSKVQTQVKTYMDKLAEQWEETPPYFITSAQTNAGRDEILTYIETINKQY